MFTPSISGSNKPFCQPLITITPYFLGSSSSRLFTGSGGLNISTEYSKSLSSLCSIGGKRGSSVAAAIAFLIISLYIFSVVGIKVPIHPLNFPFS